MTTLSKLTNIRKVNNKLALASACGMIISLVTKQSMGYQILQTAFVASDAIDRELKVRETEAKEIHNV